MWLDIMWEHRHHRCVHLHTRPPLMWFNGAWELQHHRSLNPQTRSHLMLLDTTDAGLVCLINFVRCGHPDVKYLTMELTTSADVLKVSFIAKYVEYILQWPDNECVRVSRQK